MKRLILITSAILNLIVLFVACVAMYAYAADKPALVWRN